ncbi:hypothetical protein HNQ60_000509 [Povalibacter uvarum]|uniref:Flippase-like domain-containing protein n=1 Tax=Povalibacter uvarum TaxID=732238 RepID=A0A841HG53_9GAMM|nr:lysylphosphatidylglycerol synthase transmembrane domain-containing protein [Povalibacter uvarum]MBB6091663.1 hypothetical protein [Povalibacter uvarum]
MSSNKRWLALGAGVVLSAILLVFALRDVDGAELRRVLAAARWWVIGPFLLSLFAYYWVKTVRWAYLLRSVVPGVTAGRLFAPVMIGYAAGALLPMQFGEIVRAWLGAQRLNIRMLASLMSVALERVFDLLSILLLAALAFLTAKSASAWLSSVIWLLAAGAFVALILFLIFVFRTEQCLALCEHLLGKAPPPLRARILDQLRAAATGLNALRSIRSISAVMAMSILQWLFMFACIWLSLYAMHLDLGALAAVLTTVFTVIGISLPNSPGYVGSIQLAFTLALEPFGVPGAEAIAASLFFHLLAYVSVVVCGLAMLPVVGMSVRDVAKGTREANAESNTP